MQRQKNSPQTGMPASKLRWIYKKKKRLDCQEVRFDYRDDEGMQVMAGNVVVSDSLLFFLTREKRDIFDSEIQLFHCFHWQWVFWSLHTGD